MKLIPPPRKINTTQEIITNKSVAFCNDDLDHRLVKAIQKLPICENGLLLSIRFRAGEDESYTLDISHNGIAITASSTVGAFYGIQTLRQSLEN
jgi:N-acetyl-beta-hexosaminidase